MGFALLAAVRPDLMVVDKVEFSGNQRATEFQLRHLSDLRNGAALWSVDVEAVAEGVKRHPWVREVDVRKVWPTKLVIDVVEFEPVAVLHYDDLLYVDEEGVPFMQVEPADIDYPHLTGIGPELEAEHPALPGLATQSALGLLDSLEQRALVATDLVSEVHFSRSRGLEVHTAGARLVFGLEGLESQLDRLELLVREQGLDLSQPTHVDLAPATVAIVRPLAVDPRRTF